MKKIANNVESTLAVGITAGSTTIIVDDTASPQANFPVPGGDAPVGVATISDSKIAPTKIEVVYYAGVTDNGNGTHSLTGVTRAQEGTAAQAFDSGAYIAQQVTQGLFQDLQDLIDAIEADVSTLQGDLAGKADAAHSHAASNVTTGTFADARIAESSVVQHQGALAITEAQISDLQPYLTTVSGLTWGTMQDVVYSSLQNGEIAVRVAGAWRNQTLAEAGISEVGHTHSAADLTSGLIPVARVPAGAVTQHEAALAIDWSQVSGAPAYLLDITAESLGDLSDVEMLAPAAGELLVRGASEWTNQTLAEAGISAVGHGHAIAAVTGLQSALDGKADTAHTHTASEVTAGTFADARISQSSVTQHEAEISHDALKHYDVDQHRTIDDAGSGATDLWSAQKISDELAGKADSSHTHTAGQVSALPIEWGIACSDETSDLQTGTEVATFRAVCAATLTGVRASVSGAPAGSVLTVDINKNGTSILSTKLTIDAGEKTSVSAATPPVISTASISDDDEITIDIDTVGSSAAGKGLKVHLIGTRA